MFTVVASAICPLVVKTAIAVLMLKFFGFLQKMGGEMLEGEVLEISQIWIIMLTQTCRGKYTGKHVGCLSSADCSETIKV